MSKVRSAGYILISRKQILLGHPTESTGTTHGWGLPKGKLDGDETIEEAATREFFEETNFKMTNGFNNLIVTPPYFTYHVGSNKTVHVLVAFDLAGSAYDFPFKCTSLVAGTNFPEMDKFMWVTPEQAVKMCTPSQEKLFKALLDELDNNKAFKALYDATGR